MITQNREDYLRAIFYLNEQGAEKIKSVNIAQFLNYRLDMFFVASFLTFMVIPFADDVVFKGKKASMVLKNVDEIFETEEVNGETTGRVDDKEGDKKEDFVWGSAVFSDEELLGDSILEDMDDEKADKTDELFNDDEAVFSDESFKQEEFDDSITSSIAEDLLGEELGEENTTQGTDDEYEQRESFVEIMKDMGFDRTTVLPNSTETKRKQTESAVKELNVKRYVESGLWFYKQGLYNKARDEFQKAIDEDPNYLEASQYMGDTLYRLGKLDEAKKIYEEVRKLDPDNVYVLENLGVILANQGEYKKAVWLWGEVLKLNPARRDIIDKIRHLQKIIRQKYS